MSQPLGNGPRLINLSELGPDWQWLKKPFAVELPDWHHVSSVSMPGRLPLLRAREARWRAVREAARLVDECASNAVLVSHGPRPAAYWGAFAPKTKVLAHDVISFNFTDMPRGIGRRFFTTGFRGVSRFIVSSEWEREYYSEYFNIPLERLEFRHWGMQPPADSGVAPLIAGPYVSAVGSQARDYSTLVEAARMLPAVRFVIVGGYGNLNNVQLPSNVEFLRGIPLGDAMNILRHSLMMVLPMNSALARCGHVTAVSALHLGTPIIATHCRGLDDYLREGDTAKLVRQGDGRAIADAIHSLAVDEPARRRIGAAGQEFAKRFCSEESVIRAFRSSLISRGLLAAGVGAN